MKGRGLRIICVGKIKTACWKQACEHYIKLLAKWRKIECLEVRDSLPGPDTKSRVLQEGQKLLDCLEPGVMTITLAENGRQFTSLEFTKILQSADMTGSGRLDFIIGGPYGVCREVIQKSAFCLSLSAMTWPHELARVLLLEQLFRAESILRNFPYHNP